MKDKDGPNHNRNHELSKSASREKLKDAVPKPDGGEHSSPKRKSGAAKDSWSESAPQPGNPDAMEEQQSHTDTLRQLAVNGNEHIRVKVNALPRSIKPSEGDWRTYFEGFGVDQVRFFWCRLVLFGD